MLKIRISIVIPVYQEQDIINILLDDLSVKFGELDPEIIIVDGDQKKSTLNCVTNRKVIKISCSPGRARQMNQGAAVANGDILLFLHADTILPDQALNVVSQVISEQNYVAGAFSLDISGKKLIYKILAKTITLRSKLTRIPYGDQAQFFLTSYFRKIGGYREIPIMEDVEIMHRLKKNRIPICLLPHSVLTSPRRWQEEGFIFVMIRNPILSTLYYCGVTPEKLVNFYKIRKRS